MNIIEKIAEQNEKITEEAEAAIKEAQSSSDSLLLVDEVMNQTGLKVQRGGY